MSNNVNKTSKALKTVRKARKVGDVHPKHPHKVWTEYKPGKFDWRHKKSSKTPTKKENKFDAAIKKQTSKRLREMASGENNAPKVRMASYKELQKRGEDVSDIDLDTGKLGRVKRNEEAMGENAEADADLQGGLDMDSFLEDAEDENEWTNPDYIKKKFGGLKTKAQRIEADAFVHNKKVSQPNYQPPHVEVNDMNKTIYGWLKSESPLLILAGGAGIGKSYNFHGVAQDVLGMRPMDPNKDEVGDGDYDYVEVGEVNSVAQLASILKEHNGKTILFDDTDNVLKEKEAAGLMKKATASSGKRIVGKKSTQKNSNVDPFEFTGKIAFLTNMTGAELTKDEHAKAIYSRAVKKDIHFTKREQLSFIRRLKHLFDFIGVERLPNKADDEKMRNEVFDVIEQNIDEIDPRSFNSRTMKEALELRQTIEATNEALDTDNDGRKEMLSRYFGQKDDWREKLKLKLTKGYNSHEKDELKKASKILKLEEY